MKLRNEVKEPKAHWSIEEPDILKVECQEESITVYLSDNRVISIPKTWYKSLREATPQQLSKYEILPRKKSIYFPELEEYLSIKSFTHGLGNSCC